MADQNAPNSVSDKDKAEGERPKGNPGKSGTDVSNRYDESDGGDAGITNRPIEEEKANQEAVPERGKTKEESGHDTR
ncbi:MAG: hypothetical protein H0X67_17765 [Acidobacteria bacterium]|nr:hypothetical protein [Acidobacteriota bacterium]